jgi:hypothetical protein
MDLNLWIPMPEIVMKSKNLSFFRQNILILFMIIFILSACCAEKENIPKEKITMDVASRIALNDPQTIQLINSHDFTIEDVNLGSLSGNDGKPENVYEVSIEVPNGTYKRIIVFVNFTGHVIFVDTPSTAKYPDSQRGKQYNGTPP